MKYIGPFLPYIAFAAMTIVGMHYQYNWVIVFGIIAIFCYRVEC